MSSIAPGSVPIVFARLRRNPWSVVGRSGPPWARRNSSAGTTRISRPSPSRIVTGATLSSSAAALPSADFFMLPLETRLSGAWVRRAPCGKVMSQGGVSWGRCLVLSFQRLSLSGESRSRSDSSDALFYDDAVQGDGRTRRRHVGPGDTVRRFAGLKEPDRARSTSGAGAPARRRTRTASAGATSGRSCGWRPRAPTYAPRSSRASAGRRGDRGA
jgi:hypothetical protein